MAWPVMGGIGSMDGMGGRGGAVVYRAPHRCGPDSRPEFVLPCGHYCVFVQLYIEYRGNERAWVSPFYSRISVSGYKIEKSEETNKIQK